MNRWFDYIIKINNGYFCLTVDFIYYYDNLGNLIDKFQSSQSFQDFSTHGFFWGIYGVMTFNDDNEDFMEETKYYYIKYDEDE